MRIKSAYASVLASVLLAVQGAVVPPPWADPTYNPCASQPGGWQLIYWPPDKKCYRIFTRGYPCPDTMELGPGPDKGTPECNCPPGTAQNSEDSKCHQLYEREICNEGEYFAPITTKIGRGRWGKCQRAKPCAERDHLFWPKDGRCYPKNTRGPCVEGQLLIRSNESVSLGKCGCANTSELAQYFWPLSGTCHEYYTTGPCQERGGLFLPGATCGCNPDLPHYHNATNKCYQLGTIGPCLPGHQFDIPQSNTSHSIMNTNRYAECICKNGHFKWFGDGACYRPYTRGPCSTGSVYSINITATGMAIGCIPLPCPPGKLYFPMGNGCHRVGTQGPCPNGQVVLFQDSVKTSVESISYLGMCGCPSINDKDSFFPSIYRVDNETSCKTSFYRTLEANTIAATHFEGVKSKSQSDNCGDKRGTIAWSDGTCKQLYYQGPCNPGEWVVPDRSKGQRKGRGWKMGKCECRPGYSFNLDETTNTTMCQPPTVVLARFLNNRTNKSFNKWTNSNMDGDDFNESLDLTNTNTTDKNESDESEEYS